MYWTFSYYNTWLFSFKFVIQVVTTEKINNEYVKRTIGKDFCHHRRSSEIRDRSENTMSFVFVFSFRVQTSRAIILSYF